MMRRSRPRGRGLIAAASASVLAMSGIMSASPPVHASENDRLDVGAIMEQRLEALGDNCPAVALYLLTGTAPSSGNILFNVPSDSRKNPVPVDFLDGATSGLEGTTLGPLLTAVDGLLLNSGEREVWKKNVLLVDFSVDEYPATMVRNAVDLLVEKNLGQVYGAFHARQSVINARLAEKGCGVSPLPLFLGYSQGAGLSSRIVTLDADMRRQAQARIVPLSIDGVEFATPSCAGVFTVPAADPGQAARASTNCHTPAEQFFVIADPYQNPVHPGNWDSGRFGLGIAGALTPATVGRAENAQGQVVRSPQITQLGTVGESMCFLGDIVCSPPPMFLFLGPTGVLVSAVSGGVGVRIHLSYQDNSEKIAEAAERLIDAVNALITKHSDVKENLLLSLPEAPDIPVDVAIVLDTTGSMRGLIRNAKRQALDIVTAIESRPEGGRVAVVVYRDIYQDLEYISRVECAFGVENLESCIQEIELASRGSLGEEETVYSGIMTAINDLAWSSSGLRHIIVIGDAGPKDPEPMSGFTFESVREALRGLNAMPPRDVAQPPSGTGSETQSRGYLLSVLADSFGMQRNQLMSGLAVSSGGVFLPTQLGSRGADVGLVVRGVIDDSENAIVHQPRAFLYAPELEVAAGEDIFISGAWSSYAGAAPTFEFDFDGDGIFELRTFQSSVSHSFQAAGQHTVAMQITDEFGRTSPDAVTFTVSDVPDLESILADVDTSFDGSVSLSHRQLSPGATTTMSLTGLRVEEQWGFRLVPYGDDDPWTASPVYVSDAFTPEDISGTDSATVGSDFPLGDYRVLVATSDFRFVDAGRLIVGDDEGIVAAILETASPGTLAATILSFIALIGLLIALMAQTLKRRGTRKKNAVETESSASDATWSPERE